MFTCAALYDLTAGRCSLHDSFRLSSVQTSVRPAVSAWLSEWTVPSCITPWLSASCNDFRGLSCMSQTSFTQPPSPGFLVRRSHPHYAPRHPAAAHLLSTLRDSFSARGDSPVNPSCTPSNDGCSKRLALDEGRLLVGPSSACRLGRSWGKAAVFPRPRWTSLLYFALGRGWNGDFGLRFASSAPHEEHYDHRSDLPSG